MGRPSLSFGSLILAIYLLLLVLPSPAAAFGAGNIPSIAQIEGSNFRHGGRIIPIPWMFHAVYLFVFQISKIFSRLLRSSKAINGLLYVLSIFNYRQSRASSSNMFSVYFGESDP
jgi:hypothetical protein